MKTTKKDVADEGLIYMQGVSRKAEDESEVNPSTEVVDLQDVHISIPPYQRPIGMVSPMTKDPSSQSSFSASGGEPPVRPARSHRQSSFDSSPSLSGGGMHSPMITSSLSQPASTSPGDPINIHVSVTINPGPALPNTGGSSYASPSGNHFLLYVEVGLVLCLFFWVQTFYVQPIDVKYFKFPKMI